ncbi:MAG: NAD(P)H-dependent oxidoreductase [Gammaproteobacteria bacterium]|nr:NAD(P)H-dependent oxidoreductase [Gammaproteobacteria bacterium]
MSASVKVIAICGSLRETSFTRMALELALNSAAELGADTQLIDLREFNLIFCDGSSDGLPADVLRLRKLVGDAQGIILGTPEYHGGYSGVLKNALDLMGFEEFEGKMVGLVGVSAGSQGAAEAVNSLRTVGRALHAWVVPEQVSIPFVDGVFEKTGQCKDENVTKRLESLGRQVARFSFLHSSSDAMDFIRAWEEAPNNPGANY